MNGVHDFGGTQGHGPVNPEPDEPPFHDAWEKRALALTLAMGATGEWNIDMARFARESLPPEQYLASSYYQIWLAALENMMVERGLASRDEIEAGVLREPAKPVKRVLAAADVARVLARGTVVQREASAPAKFAIGDSVRMRNLQPTGHTRLPRYVRGHAGRIEHVHGVFVFADAHSRRVPGANAFDESPQWLYTVAFDGRELWGDEGDAATRISVDAWEPYLEAA